MKDLKVFASFNEELFKEITQLLTLENFRFRVVISFVYFNIVVVHLWNVLLKFLYKFFHVLQRK